MELRFILLVDELMRESSLLRVIVGWSLALGGLGGHCELRLTLLTPSVPYWRHLATWPVCVQCVALNNNDRRELGARGQTSPQLPKCSIVEMNRKYKIQRNQYQ